MRRRRSRSRPASASRSPPARRCRRAPMPSSWSRRRSRDGDAVTIGASVTPRQNVGARAADIARGTTFLRAGDSPEPSRLGALAATGHVAGRRLRAADGGDRLDRQRDRRARRAARPGQIYDINRVTLSAVVERHGGVAMPLSSADDRLGDLAARLDRALGEDVVVFSGGSSVGERDLVRIVLRERGRVHLSRHRRQTRQTDGLRASSTASRCSACPAIRRRASRTPTCSWRRFFARWRASSRGRPRTIEAPLSRRIVSVADRHQFYTVRIEDGKAEPAFKASGDITSLANADGYIEIEAGVSSVEAGQSVTCTLF